MLFRLLQSIPSKKAEPFKLWLAKTGYERIQEIENPELGQNRIKQYYELKGYPKDWIDKRLRGIAIRQELTDECKISARKGGKIAQNARTELEQETEKSIISPENYVHLAKNKKKILEDT